MGFFRLLLITLIIFFGLVTFLGPVVYYPCWYACYGVEWTFRQISSAIDVIWIDWLFDFMGAIFDFLKDLFKYIYYNWGLFAWCGWI